MTALAAGRKRLFLGLMAGTILAVTAALTILWYVSVHQIYIYQKLLLFLGVLLVFIILILAAIGFGWLTLMLWRGRIFSVGQEVAGVAVNLLFPLALQMGRLLRFDEELVRSSFVEVNNQFLELRNIRIKPEELLILAPHCIQYNECIYKITRDLRNCRMCGQCRAGLLMALSEKYEVRVAVVTGGTRARKLILEHRPKVVIAIACERELTSGILDCYPLPVYGILNERPNGPCNHTEAPIDKILASVAKFTGRKELYTVEELYDPKN